MSDEFVVRPVGYVRSSLVRTEDAPMQGFEGAPDAWVEILPDFRTAAAEVAPGDRIILVTWFHEADRSVMQVHPRDDQSRPLTGVFSTRSPERPNPLGLHRVTVRAVEDGRLRVGPLEAIDGTPVVDIKPVLDRSDDA